MPYHIKALIISILLLNLFIKQQKNAIKQTKAKTQKKILKLVESDIDIPF
jgi:hypothetical protein